MSNENSKLNTPVATHSASSPLVQDHISMPTLTLNADNRKYTIYGNLCTTSCTHDAHLSFPVPLLDNHAEMATETGYLSEFDTTTNHQSFLRP